MKKSITFIINPISGGIKKDMLPALIGKYIDKNIFDIEIVFTRSAEHNVELAQKAVEQKKDIVVAVGGDGTINHIAKFVTGTQSTMAIVPVGSGNGLARHLGLSLNHERSLKIINQLKTISVDTGKANDAFFINVAGAGFDAHVSHMFATAPKRGLISYAKITLAEFARYKSRSYELIIDGNKVNENAFLVCVANGSQYGNNAFIAPGADLTDGVFEVSVLKPFLKRHVPFIGLEMFTKKFGNSAYVKTYRGKHIIINRPFAEVVNIDGEPVMLEKDLDIQINPASLKVIVP